MENDEQEQQKETGFFGHILYGIETLGNYIIKVNTFLTHINEKIQNQQQQPQEQPQDPPIHIDDKHVKMLIRGINCILLKINFDVLSKLKDAIRVRQNLDISKASSYLKLVNESNQPIPDDIVDRIILASVESKTLSSNTKPESILFLQNAFPNISKGFIENELSSHKFMLLDTVHFIDTYKDPPKPLFSQQKQTTLTFDDIIVSAQLLQLYSEDVKKQEIKRQEEEEERLMLEAIADNSLYECECCFCGMSNGAFSTMSRRTSFCFKCIRKQIETSISEGRTEVPCLHYGGCNEKVPMSELERSVPKELLQQLSQAETLNAILSADIKGTVKCYKCGYIAIVENYNYMECPSCKAKTCALCQSEYHKGMTCEQFKNLDKNKVLEEKMSEAVIRECPKCKTQFVKEEGCNKMECPRCHSLICYWCRKIIPNDVGYNHFWRGNLSDCPPNMCPLWVQNNELHQMEAEQVKAMETK
ncbi:IBR domain containing protein [Histomonas meleagridis]|uniref:IBR domain containing protein n=1 Tax=Histomonas meleagridis TaxID=135588 RepID=UPI00355AAAB0|nr:IBR domain containing protein [Histomonas meleagridis]